MTSKEKVEGRFIGGVYDENGTLRVLRSKMEDGSVLDFHEPSIISYDDPTSTHDSTISLFGYSESLEKLERNNAKV